MNLQRRISKWMTENRVIVGVGLVLFFGIGSSIAATFVPTQGSERSSDWLAYVLLWAAAICAYWYRTKPLEALLAAIGFVVAYWILDYPGGLDPVLWLLFFAATRYGGLDRRRVWRIVLLAFAIIMGVATLGVIVPTEDLPAIALLGIFVIHGAFAFVGEAFFQRSQYVAELEQRTAALEADLENKAALAAVEERTRIAREMHDIIAHGMSTVVVQAQAAQSVVDTNPSRAREVLETIERIGRDSVDEMRRMLGVLREESTETEFVPQPTFGDLHELHSHVADSGVDFELDVTGDERPLPPGLELTGYRVVQEALTNVMRHAGRPVRVVATVNYGENDLEISVVDDGLGAAASPATAGTGHGQVGMRERVEIYNGTFSAGPNPGGGYSVNVTLPITARVNA